MFLIFFSNLGQSSGPLFADIPEDFMFKLILDLHFDFAVKKPIEKKCDMRGCRYDTHCYEKQNNFLALNSVHSLCIEKYTFCF